MGRPLRALYANGTFNALSGVANTTEIITTAIPHGFSNGMAVVYTVSTGNTAVSGLTSGSTYYVINAVSGGTTLQLSTSLSGTAINLTAGLNQTGHTLASSGSPATGVIEMSDSEILDLVAPLTQNYAVASPAVVRGTRLRAIVSSAEDLVVGSFVDVRNAAVGTHPSSNTTVSTKTLYQNIETQAILPTGPRPAHYVQSGGEVQIRVMTDADLLAAFYPAILNAVVTGGVGGYYLSLTSSGAPGTGTWESAVTFDDTYYVGSTLTTDSYTLWHRIDAAPLGTLRPVKIDTTASATNLVEMTDANIEQVGRYIGEYIRTTGIGTYVLQQSAPGTGTWISRGSIANKVNDLTDVSYTGYYDHSFTGAFTGAYTGAFTGNYTGLYAGTYSQLFTGAYTGIYSRVFTGSYLGAYSAAFTGVYTGTYSGGYAGTFTGSYLGTYSQAFTGNYSGTYSRVFTGAYAGAYTGTFNQTFTGSYLGNYNQAFTGSYLGTYNNTFTGLYSGTYNQTFTGSYSGTYSRIFTTNFTGVYSRAYTGIYNAQIPHSYSGTYQLAQYTSSYATAVVLGYLSAPANPRGSAPIVGHAVPIYYTHQSTPAGSGALIYTSTRYDQLIGPHYSTNPRGALYIGIAGYPVTYHGYYSPSTFTHTTFSSVPKMNVVYNPRGAATVGFYGSSQTTYSSYYSGFFTGAYTGYYTAPGVPHIYFIKTSYFTGAYSGGYVGAFTGAYSGGYTGSFSGLYSGGYVGAFTGSYSGGYVGVFTGAYSGGYTGAFSGAYSGLYSGGYTGSFSGLYSGSYTGAFTGAYVGGYTSIFTGAYSGPYTGNYGNAFTGAYSGGYVGAFSGAYAGGYTGAFTGVYVGTYAGTYSQSFTGIYNQAFTRAFTAVWTGLTVQTTTTSSSYTLWVRTA